MIEKVVKIKVDTGDSDKDVKALAKEFNKLEREAKEVDSALKKATNPSEILFLTKKQKELNIELGKTAKRTRKIGGEAKKAGVLSKGLSSGFAAMPASIQSAVTALKVFKTALISTGVGAIIVALGSLVGLFITANRKGAEFSKGLSGLKAVTGSTSEELKVLSKQAKELGSTTAFTSVEVVKLQTELAKLGFTVKDIENATPAILDLSASLEVDLASAAEFAGSAVKSFGLETSDTQRIVDVMALSTASSALNFDALRESMKISAPTAKALGISVERTTALLGILADTGLKGSVAGTGLGKTFIELNKQGISLEDAFDKVNKSSNKLNTAIDLVGIVGSKSLLNLASAGDRIGDLEDKFNNAAGAAKRIAETRLDNLTGDTTKLSSAWEGFLLSVEDGEGTLNKISRGAIQLLTKSIDWLGIGIESMGFLFTDTWTNIKLFASAGSNVISGVFNGLGATIKLFANNALLAISNIPIIGKAIDKDKIKNNLIDAENELAESKKRIIQGTKEYATAVLRDVSKLARLAIHLEEKKNRDIARATEEAVKKAKEQASKLATELTEEQKEAALKAIEEEKKRLKSFNDFKKSIDKQNEDLDAKTEEEKLALEKERSIAKLESLVTTEEEKRIALLAINELYDQKELELKAEQKATADELKAEQDKKDLEDAQKLAEEKIKIDDEITASKLKGLSILTEIFGKESALGRAALIAKQAIALQELLIDLGAIKSKATKTVAEASMDGAKSASSTSTGLAATLALGFPAAIPALVGYAGAAVGIIAGVTSAVKGAKQVGAKYGGGAGSGRDSQAPKAPAFNLVQGTGTNQIAESLQSGQDPVKAYVVSSDVTSGQSLDRNIEANASI